MLCDNLKVGLVYAGDHVAQGCLYLGEGLWYNPETMRKPSYDWEIREPLEVVREWDIMANKTQAEIRTCAQDQFTEFLEKHPEDGSVSRFLVLSEYDNNLVPEGYIGPCHAGMNRVRGNAVALVSSPATHIWPTWNNGGKSRGSTLEDVFELDRYPEDCEMYWQWLLHESPWANVFLTKPSSEAARRVGVVMDVHCPGNLTCAALTATRIPHEFPSRVRVWADIVRRGGDPVSAIVLAECVYTISPQEGNPAGMGISQYSGGIHDMFYPARVCMDSIRNMRGGVIVEDRVPLVDKCGFGGVQDLWGQSRGDSVLGKVKKYLKPVKVDPGAYMFEWSSLSIVKRRGVDFIDYNSGVDQLTALSLEIKEASCA